MPLPTDFEFTLGDYTQTDAKEFDPPDDERQAIDRLAPGSEHHKYVLEYLLQRLKASENAMSKFYARWQVAERKMQAYMSLPNYEKMLKEMNNKSKPPAPAIIIFPYKYAVVSTIVTYCMKVFCGRKPYFALSASGAEAANNVPYMEAMLQYHADMCKMAGRIFQLLLDGELYGVGVVRTVWTAKKGKRRVMRPPSDAERLMFASNPQAMPSVLKDYEIRDVFAGNDISNVDPFMFFPDPNVPMTEVAEKGEFVFWREFLGKHVLIKGQQQGSLKWVESVDPQEGTNFDTKWANLSQRSALSGGQSHAGENPRQQTQNQPSTYMVDQGSVVIIPRELGLGTSEEPERWLFTILNKKQIVQAVPLDMDHGEHPVSVSEPYSLGYGFGQPGIGDYVGPIQDIMSWFIDSHIYNIRSSLNNQWLYDPSKIESDDLKYPQPGKQIRLKPLAYGTDVRTALMQFPVTDVTRNHIGDMTSFMKIGDMVSAVNDVARGVQATASRKTATATRMEGENAFGRLAVHAQLISENTIMRMARQMVLNIQQFQESDAWLRLIGQEQFQQVGPQLLMGDFTYVTHDGTLPLDRVAGFDMWKEILLGMAQNQTLQQTHSLPKVFEHVCTLGGAPNIASFRLVPDAQLDAAAKAGNAIPLGQMPQAQGGVQ